MNCLISSPRSMVRDALRRTASARSFAVAMYLVAITANGVSYAEPPASVPERRFPLPMLSVDAENRGNCVRPRFTFVRIADENTPLSLAVSEDTPGGAGESIRASMWLAAMVASLDRMDPLAGTKVSLELSGAVDGPSAGAVLCLAILSALDGRDFPSDCAVTGTIMPDGTIGGVGGVAAKLRAAANAGLRRVVTPTYVRFEKQPGAAEDVDLKRLAAELKLELIAVENVTQAYAALHGLAPVARLAPDRSVLELPVKTEEALKERYQTHRQAGTEIWNAVPQADKDRIASDPNAKHTYIDERVSAESAYRTGRLGSATNHAWTWHVALAARKAHLDYAAKQQPLPTAFPQDIAEGIARTKRRITELAAGFHIPENVLKSPPRHSESGAQLWVDYYELSGTNGLNDSVQAEMDRKYQEFLKPELKEEEVKVLRAEIPTAHQIQLLLAQICAEAARTWPGEQELLAETLPLRPIVERPDGIERLFYNAQLAVRNTFRHDVVGFAAGATQMSTSQVLETLKAIDMKLSLQESALEAAERIHSSALAAKDATARRYALAVSTHLSAEALAAESALTVRWNQLDTNVDAEGVLVYGRTDLLNYLITTARENALRALAQCKERELVALGPITRFEMAEMFRDDVATDKVEVLATYWSASLQAKVLLMLCGTTKNLPSPIASAPKQAQAPRPSSTESASRWLLPPPAASRSPVTQVFSTKPSPPPPVFSTARPATRDLQDAMHRSANNNRRSEPSGPQKWPWATVGAAWFFWYLFRTKAPKQPN